MSPFAPLSAQKAVISLPVIELHFARAALHVEGIRGGRRAEESERKRERKREEEKESES